MYPLSSLAAASSLKIIRQFHITQLKAPKTTYFVSGF